MYKEYKLDNGLVVALQDTPTKTIAAKLRVNYGSSHENIGEEGLAHFLEHCLVTGGSEKYDPKTVDEIRGSFAYSNAFCNIGRTNFVGQILSEDIELWLDCASDHAFRPRLDLERVNGERERVLREISDTKSNSMYPVNVEFNKIFYRDHPKGRFNLGREDVVRSTNSNDLRRFHSRGFHPNNMDLIIVGGLPENIEEIVGKYFSDIPVGENTRKEFPKFKPLRRKITIHKYARERNNTDNPEESSAQIFLAYLGPSENHKDASAIKTMCHILGAGTNSFLFQNMGLKKGLAYHVNAMYDGHYNAGEMQIHAIVPANRIDESIDVIFEELKKIKTQKVNDNAIESIKKIAKYDLAKTFESNEGHASEIEHRLDYGLTQEDLFKRYNSVTAEKIMEVANKYLPDKEYGEYVLYIRDPLKKE